MIEIEFAYNFAYPILSAIRYMSYFHEHVFRARAKFRSKPELYNFTFLYEQNLCVHLTAYDQDIYTKPSELASVVIPLSQKCKEICTQQEGVELTNGLKQVPKVSVHTFYECIKYIYIQHSLIFSFTA